MRKKYARIRTEKEGTATAAYPRIVDSSITSRSLLRIVGGLFFYPKTSRIRQHAQLCWRVIKKKMPHFLKNSAY